MGLFDDVLNEGGSSAEGGLFDDVLKAPKKQNKGLVADIGTDLKRGVQNIPSAITGLADIPVAAVTGSPLISAAAEGLGKMTGFQPGQWAKEAEQEYSEGRKQARQNIDAAWKDGTAGDIASAYLQNPSQIVGSIAESLPSMLVGGLAGRGLTAASKLISPVVGAGLGEGAVMAGQAMDNLTEQGVDPRTAAGYAAGTGLVGAALGAGGGKVAQMLGVVDPETAIAGGAARAIREGANATKWQAAKETGKNIIGGGISEGIFEELPQSVMEQAFSNLAQDKPIGEGVARAGVEGALAGFGMGAGFNAIPAKQQGPLSRTVDAGRQSGAIIDPATIAAAEQFRQRPDAIPAGSFGQMNEFANFLNDEQADLAGRREAVRDTIPFQKADIPSPLSLASDAQQQEGIPFEGNKPQAPDWSIQGNGSFADQAELANLIESEKADLNQLRNPKPQKEEAKQGNGSFSNMNEFADLLNSERQQVESSRRAIAARQALRRESDLESADARVADSMAKESEQKRRSVLESVLSDPAVKNHAAKFSAELKRQGFRNVAPTESELSSISRFGDILNAQPETTIEPSLPNEATAEQMGIKERKETAQTQGTQRDKIAEVKQLVSAGWKVNGRTLVSPTGKKRNLNFAERYAAVKAQQENRGDATQAQPLDQEEAKANDAQAGTQSAAAQEAEGLANAQGSQGRINADSKTLDGSTVYDSNGNPYRVHYQRNHLVVAHPIVDGKAQVNADSTVRFWVTPDRSPSSDNDRTDPIYSESPVDKTPAKIVNESRGPAPISKRDDLVGAIMRVTGGKGIANSMKLDVTGDTKGNNRTIAGLFTDNGTADLGEIAELLSLEEGYSVRDGNHLAELVRDAAAGNMTYSMARTEREAAENAEKEYKASVNQKAAELGLKKVGGKRTLAMVEADIEAKEKEISEQEAREERASIQTSEIAEDIYQEGSELTEADLMQWIGDRIEYSQDEINEANSRASERESRRVEKNAGDDSQEQAQGSSTEGARTSATEAGARPTESLTEPTDDLINRAKALGMKTVGVSAEKLTKQVEEAEARANGSSSARGDAGSALTKEQRKSVLKTLVDVYRKNNAPKEFKGIDNNGNERSGYAYSPEYFVRSDITGAMVRYYVTLPDGRIAHPTELFADYTQSDIDAALQKEIDAARQQEDGDKSRLESLKRRIGETLNVANRKYNAANPNRDDTVPAILTDGNVFIRTAPENVANDLRLLGKGWKEQKPESFNLSKQTNDQAAAEFKRQQEEANKKDEEPAAPAVRADQVDMWNTQGSLIDNNREPAQSQQKTDAAQESAQDNAPTPDKQSQAESVIAQAESIEPDAESQVESITAGDRIRSTAQENKIADFGEKIGGARKDKATPLGPRAKIERGEDERPAWSRKYIAMQIEAGSLMNRANVGKWQVMEKISNGRRSGAVSPLSRNVFDTEAEAMAALPHLVVSKKHRVYQFTPRNGGDKKYGIFRNITEKKRALVKGGFNTYEEAMQYIADNPVEIIEHKFGYPERPWLDRIERIGTNRLDGDVSTQMFADTFGFRAGEFGNWNMGGDGQAALNHAYEALLDLADAIGVPPKALSLNGRLAIAFGARGTGGKGSAAAHYEPGAMVINLTKIKGAGSLAHEWWHAVDHYFAATSGRKDSDSVISSGYSSVKNDARPELIEAIKRVVDTMMYSTTSQTTDATLIRDRAKKRIEESIKSIDYYNNDLRGYLKDGTYNRGKKVATKEQLAQWDSLIERLKQGDTGAQVYIENPSKMRGAMGFHTGEVIRDMNAIYKSVTGRSFMTKDPQSRGNKLFWQADSIKDNQERLKTKEDVTTAVRGRSSYFVESRNIDNQHTSDYWSSPEEMGARAFESYIFDKIAAQGNRSDYLVHGVENRFYSAFDMYPYPEGDERVAINGAFDNLFSTIKTKETDNGIAMYSKSQGSVSAPMQQSQAEQRIKSLLGNKVGRLLIESGVITFTNKGSAYQGATYTNGTIALNLDALSADNFDGVLLHEGFHSTIRQLVGEETYAKLMKQLESMLAMGRGAQWVKDANAAVPKDTAPENVTEEIAAYAIEQHKNGGKIPSVLQRWVHGFLSAIRTAIIQRMPNGKLKLWAVMNLKAQDLARLAKAGLKSKAAGMESAQREAMAYSQDGDKEVPYSTVSGHEIDGSDGDTIQRKATNWMRANLQGKSFKNDEQGWDISIGRKGINKSMMHSAKEIHSRSVAAIPSLLKNAILVSSEENRDPAERINIPTVHHFYAPLRVGGKDYLSRIIVKETKDGQKFYDYETSDEVSPANLAADAHLPKEGAATKNAGLVMSMDKLLSHVKKEHGGTDPKFSKINQTATDAFKKWFGKSKVVDENGKPAVWYHGTTEDFSEFRTGVSDAIFVTPKAEFANDFSMRGMGTHPSMYDETMESDGLQPNVMPVFVKAENPFDYENPKHIAKLLDKMTFDPTDSMLAEIEAGEFPTIESDAVQNAIKAAGFDAFYVMEDHKNLGLFSPNQIKSATGNNGNFDASNPDIRYSKASQAIQSAVGAVTGEESKIVGASSRQYDQAQRQFFKNVGRDVERKNVIGRTLDYLRSDFWKKMAVGIVDQFRGLRDLGDNGQAYLLARLSKGTAGALDALLNHGKLSLRDGVYDADTSGGFLQRLGVTLNGEIDDFLWWTAANRAEKLSQEDRENLFTPQDIAAGKSLATGTTAFDYTVQTGPLKGKVTRNRAVIYADANRVFNEFQKNALDMAEQSGLIDGSTRHLWESEFYVPFYRVSDEDGEFVGAKMGNALVRQSAFKKLKGGTDKLNADLLANTLMNWSHLIEASAKNRAAKASLEAAGKMGAAQRVAATMGEYAKANGSMLPPGTKGAVWYMDGGKKIEYLVSDPFVMTAITSLEYAGMRNAVMDVMSKFKHYLTIGVTANPAFKIRNLIRDSIQAIGTSDLGYNPITNIKEGIRTTRRDSQEYVSALASGGLIRFGTMLENSEADRVRQLIKSGVKDSTILNNENKLRAFYDQYLEPAVAAYNELGNRSEEINRAALYNQLIKQGKSHAEAALLARDLMDFSLQGSFTTIRFLSQVVPFFNARLQGMYKLGRATKENPAKLATVIGACAVASIALMLGYDDDEDWKRREDFDRDGYWWFKFGGLEWRIPKPFEVGAVASLAERTLEYMINDEMTGERFRKVVGDLVKNNLSMNPVPQVIKPIIDLYANKDSFTGRPIETMNMQRLEPEMRFNSQTSLVARGLSATTMGALSPVQYDHIARAYFGWLGSFAVGMGDMAARSMSDEPEKPTADYYKLGSFGFAKEAGTGSSRYVSMIYDQAKELEQAHATYRQLVKDGKMGEAQEYMEDNKDKLSRYRSTEAVKKAESRLNEQIRLVERSNLSADEKRERINAINKQKEQVAMRLAPGLN